MKTEDFEIAIDEAGYHLDQIKKSDNNEVDLAFGTILIGDITKRVRWDSKGQCFSRTNFRMEQYNLRFKSIQK